MRGGMLAGRQLARSGIDPEDVKLPKGLLRRVWRDIAVGYRARLTLMLAVICVSSVLVVLPARLTQPIVDALADGGPDARGTITFFSLLLIVIAIAAGATNLWQRYLSAAIAERLIWDLRSRLFDHVQRMPLAFFTRTRTGALISRLNGDVVGAQRALTGTFGTLTSNLVQVVVAIGAMAAIEWRLTLASLVALPVFVLLAKQMGERLRALTRQQMSLNADMNDILTERFNVAGAALVKLFGRYPQESEAFSTRAGQVADVGVRSAVVGRVFFIALSMIGAIGAALVYLVGGRMALDGAMSPGDVVAFAALLGQAYQPLAALSNAPVDVLTALVSFDRVFEVLDLEHPIADAPDAEDLEDPRGEVGFDHVSFGYPSGAGAALASLEHDRSVVPGDGQGGEVLHDVSFRAAPGSTVALVGPSGAGKSTMLNLIPRLYDVTSGTVRIDGHDVRRLTGWSLGAAVGVVSQDPHLFHDTVRENLRYAAPGSSDDQIEQACRAARIHEVIARLPEGYDTLVGERGYRLSGGEKQRLAIARVLLADPVMVLLDEATSHLDSESEAAIQRALDILLADRTCVVIAHRLSTIVNADEILVVDSGRIVQRGTHPELVAAGGLYADLVRTQFRQPTS